MSEERPAPLVPPEVDLRGMEFMPLYGDRLFKSETWIAATPEGKVAALRIWWHAFGHEFPAASLPDNDQLLAEYAGYGVAIKVWQKIKPQVMRGWVRCSDGRWYHKVVAELALAAWDRRVRERDKKRAWREGRNRDKAGDGTGTGTGTEPGRPRSVPTRATRESTVERRGEERTGEERTTTTNPQPAALVAPPSRGSNGKSKKPETPIPADFAISERVRAWAGQKGFSQLDEHLEFFTGRMKANGKTYVDWDEALMNCIREDWGKLRSQGKPAVPDYTAAIAGFKD